MSSRTTTQITLVGSVAIRHRGGPVRTIPGGHTQVAFARLTLERKHGTTRDQLADTLWPDDLPSTWGSALRSVISRVRSFVDSGQPGANPLVAQAGLYLLDLPDDVVVDIETAEAASADAQLALEANDFAAARRLATTAVSSVEGPFLPHHDGDWVERMRERLTELLLTSLEIASLAASGLGDHGAAADFANEAVKRAPLRERAHRCRMTAHARGGNRAEALRTYQGLRRLLAQELGVDPAPETEAAYLELLGPTMVAAGGPAADHGVSTGAQAPLVGRRSELAVLDAAWSRVQAQNSHMVLITGESGVGKTRLAKAAAHRTATGGGLVLTGRCDYQPSIPFQPFVEALGGYVASTPQDMLPELSTPALEALVAVAPALQGGRVSAPALAPNQAALSAALSELMVEAARDRPVMLVVDDLHLADAQTMSLLGHVSRRCSDGSLLVVATADDLGIAPGPFTDVVGDLDRDGWLQRLRLDGLGEHDVRTLVREVLAQTPANSRPLSHDLLADTAGNAFMLLEILQWYRQDETRARRTMAPVPARIHDYASARLAALDPSERELLSVGAVAGEIFEFDLTAHACGLDRLDALDALDKVLRTGLVVERSATDPGGSHHQSEQQYRFVHDIVRRAICSQLSEPRRRDIHAHLADAIEALRREDMSHYTPAMAEHRAAGATPGGDPRAVRWARLAATQASERGSAQEEVRLRRQALEHVPPDDHVLLSEALTHLGLAQIRVGDDDSARTLLDGALEAHHCRRHDIAARAVLGLADLATTQHNLRDETAAIIDELLDCPSMTEFTGRGKPTLPRQVDDLTAARLVARLCRLGAKIRPTANVNATNALIGELHLLEGPDHIEQRLVLAGELLAIASTAEDPRGQLIASHHQAMAAELEGDGGAADEALARLASVAAIHAPVADALLSDRAVALAVAEGRFDALNPHIAPTGSVAWMEALGGPRPGALAKRQLLVAGWLRGAAVTDDHDTPGGTNGAERALAALLAGDRGRAHIMVRALASGAEPLPSGDERLHAIGLLALVAAELADRTTAETVQNLLTPYAGHVCGVGYRSFTGPASFHLGRLSMSLGDWANAERHLLSAQSWLASRGARPWLALAQHALARTYEARARRHDHAWIQALRAEATWSTTDLGVHAPVA